MDKKKFSDNLFDTKITPLDIVKILILVVTLFSTWNIIDIMTPDTSLAFIRQIAAVGVIEGAFLGFEHATKNSKNKKQMRLATVGFFCSLGVLITFAGVSGFLEFAGESILAQPAGDWLGIAWAVRDIVSLVALVVTVAWLAILASIYRLYDIADPDKQQEIIRTELDGELRDKNNDALREGFDLAKPFASIQSALKQQKETFTGILTQEEMDGLQQATREHLEKKYGVKTQASAPPPMRPANPQPTQTNYRYTEGAELDQSLIDEGFQPIPAPPLFVQSQDSKENPVYHPIMAKEQNANKNANDDGKGNGNFTNRRMPPRKFHMMAPATKRNRNL